MQTNKNQNYIINQSIVMEVAEWNKMVPSLPLLSCELSVSVKENPDRKKKYCSFQSLWIEKIEYLLTGQNT